MAAPAPTRWKAGSATIPTSSISASDVVTENNGEGADSIISSVNIGTLALNVENLTLTGAATVGGGNDGNNEIVGNTAASSLSGGNGADTLTGGVNNDTLNGGAGADKMVGGAGNDTYVVDFGSDTVSESSGEGTDDLIQSSVDIVTLAANVENLTLTGSATLGGGNNEDNLITGNSIASSLSGGVGLDTLTGGAGKDTLDGGASADSMVGGAGADVYFVNDAGDVVTESGSDIDEIKSSISIALLATGVENLTLSGTATLGGGNNLANTITGTTNNDSLAGGDLGDVALGWRWRRHAAGRCRQRYADRRHRERHLHCRCRRLDSGSGKRRHGYSSVGRHILDCRLH